MLYQKDPALQPRSSDIDKERHREELDAFQSDVVAMRAKERVEKQLEITTSHINHEYRKRIKEAREMIARLTKSKEELSTESANLNEAKEVLIEYLGKLQNPLKLNLKWVQLRKNHRRSSLGNQGVADAMDNSHRDLRGAIVKITAAINDVEVALKRVDECVAAHKQEIKDKNTTVVLDSACLLPNLEVPVRDELSVKLHSSVMRRSNLHTDQEYKNTVRALISSAPPIRQTAKQVVMKAKAVCRWIVENGFLDRPTAVVDVLKASVQDSEKQQRQLEYNAKMVQGQMIALERNRAQLLGTLEKVHQKVVETQRRLDMKLVRPVLEDSRRDIDEELERATTSLLQSELSIKNQLFDVETRRQRLILLYQDVETELQSKKRAHEIDLQCLNAQVEEELSNNNDFINGSNGDGKNMSGSGRNHNNKNNSNHYLTSSSMTGSGRRRISSQSITSSSAAAAAGGQQQQQQQQQMTMRNLQQQSHFSPGLMMGDANNYPTPRNGRRAAGGRNDETTSSSSQYRDRESALKSAIYSGSAKVSKSVKLPPLTMNKSDRK